MKATDEIALRSSSKSKRVSDELEARTTVTAPITAIITPKRSRCANVYVYRTTFDGVEGISYLPEVFSKQQGGKEAVGYESELTQ